jgi:Uma2 family endonuclease
MKIVHKKPRLTAEQFEQLEDTEGVELVDGRVPGEQLPQGHVFIPPDLAVEVISPKNRWYKVERKIDEYVSVRIPLIWVMNPDSRPVHIYRLDGTGTRLGDADELSTEPVLPGFRVRRADLLPSITRPAATPNPDV